MSNASARAKVAELAKTDLHAAIKVAEKIESPWYRSQALSYVAAELSDKDAERIVHQALKAAALGRDGYQQFTASGLPFSVLALRKMERKLVSALVEFLPIVDSIPSDVNRSDALNTVFTRIFGLGSTSWRPLFERLVACERSGRSWKCARNLFDAIILISNVEPNLAKRSAEGMAESRYKRKALE